MAKQTLESWIKEAMSDETKEGPDGKPAAPSGITLVHLQGVAEKEIHTIKFGSKPWNPRDLAQIMRHKAEGYSQDLPGIHTFCLKIFYEGSEEAQARHPFRVQVNDQVMEGLGTEPPTKLGMVQMAMRQSENLHQMLLGSLKQITDSSQAVIRAQQTQIDGLLKENADAFAIIKEKVLKEAMSQHEFRKAELEYARATEERRKLLQLAPSLVNTVVGRDVFPSAVEEESLLEVLADEITEEQAQMMMQVLPQKVVALIMPKLQKILETKRLANVQAAGLIQNPEAEAAGD